MSKLFLIQLFIIIISSCAVLRKPPLKELPLLSIDGETTIADEFLYVYEKNNFNNDSIFSSKDVDEYFNLFLNFKLKVKAAKSSGMDTTISFRTEFEGYKNQLIKPYLSEAKEQERLVLEAYERMEIEVDASHILLNVSSDASPEDTTAIYQKMVLIWEEAKSGKDFDKLAIKYSEDQSAKSNRGRLGYFSAFQMVFAFENAAYSTPIDSISDIFRSRFGYHILKVHDKRPASGKVKISHIMLRASKDQSDTISVRNKIFEIYDQILGGADWNELCRKYSEDQRTKNSGGTLPFIGLKQINDDAFEKVAFGLKTQGDISDPVNSKFGWHIIKLEEKKGLEPFEDIKSDLEQKVSSDDRSRLSQQVVISKLKQQNNFKEYPSIDKIIQLADSSLLEGKWDRSLSDTFLNDTIFVVAENYYKSQFLVEYIKMKQRRRNSISPKDYMKEMISQYIEKRLMDYEEDQLIKNNREFRMLLNEYFEGILLFEIMNEMVWEKAIKDTTGLQLYFQEHQDDYFWEERADAAIISTTNQGIFNELRKSLKSDTIRLFKIKLDPEENVEVFQNPPLDTLINLFKKYDQCSIKISLSNKSKSSKLYMDIIGYFEDNSIYRNALKVETIKNSSNKIAIELNSMSKKSLEFLYNKESALTLQVTERLFEKGDNPMLDSANWEYGIIEILDDGNFFLIVIDRIVQKQAKKLVEIKGSVISNYQNYLERKWIENLKNEYTVVLNNSTLDKIKKSYSKKFNSPD